MNTTPHNTRKTDKEQAPELDETWFSEAKQGTAHLPKDAIAAIGAQQAAKRGRPPSDTPIKKPVKIRLDADLLLHLRESGAGWQTRVNQALHDLVDEGKL